jgi:photosynthetic reaction center cytochrome c subunit
MRLFVSLLFVISLSAQAPPQEGGRAGGGPRGPQPPKNLKLLKVQGQDLITIMRGYTTALGVRCDYCHVKGDFASDDNPKKEVARKMITLAEHVNEMFGDSKVHVTCYTCHRGAQEPLTAPEAKPAAQ